MAGMKIGIVSDSHGAAGVLRRALSILTEHEVQVVVHCGDIGSSECITALSETNVPAYAVAGNMDRNPRKMQIQADNDRVRFNTDTVLVPLDGGKYLAATHGNNPHIMAGLLKDARVNYICHGHTHRTRNEKIGTTRIINPGALIHAHPPTAAILDTDADTVEYFAVK